MDIEDMQAHYEELCDQETLTEEELLEVEELHAILHPDTEPL